MPMGEYANFQECVEANQDKDDPNAYCGEIKKRTEDNGNPKKDGSGKGTRVNYNRGGCNDIIPPECIVKAYKHYKGKFPKLSERDLLDKSFAYFKDNDTTDFVVDLTEDYPVSGYTTKAGIKKKAHTRGEGKSVIDKAWDKANEKYPDKNIHITKSGRIYIQVAAGRGTDPLQRGTAKAIKVTGSGWIPRSQSFVKGQDPRYSQVFVSEWFYDKNLAGKKTEGKLSNERIYRLERQIKELNESIEGLEKLREDRKKGIFDPEYSHLKTEDIPKPIKQFIREIEEYQKEIEEEREFIRQNQDFTEVIPLTLDYVLREIAEDYEQQVQDFLTLDEYAQSRIPESKIQGSEATHLQELQQQLQEYEKSYRTPEAKALREQLGGTMRPPVKSIDVPFTVRNSETGAVIRGKVLENLEKHTRQLTPVSSSNVRGAGQFKDELLVQFHGDGRTARRTYRYQMESPEMAEEAYRSLLGSGSPGRWIWENVRGHSKGEPTGIKNVPHKYGSSLSPPGKGKKVIGGTTSSLIEYSISNRVFSRVQNFDEMSKQLKRKTSNISTNPNVGSRVEGALEGRRQARDRGVSQLGVVRQVRQLPKLDFTIEKLTNDLIVNITRRELDILLDGIREINYYDPNIQRLLQKINSQFTGIYREQEEKVLEMLLEYNQNHLKNMIATIHDSIIDLLDNDDISEEMEEQTDYLLEPGVPLVLEDIIEYSFGMLFNHFKPEDYGEEAEGSYRVKFDKIIENDDYSGFIDILTDKVIKLGKEESEKWKELTKEELGKLKKIKRGKGWFGESERHSRARKTGKADLVTDNLVFSKVQKLKKLDFTIGDPSNLTFDAIDLNEFKSISNDFNKDFSILEGPITRAGAFPYNLGGYDITLYKQWDNLKDIFSKLDYLPLIGSQGMGSHYAKPLGFAYNFRFDNDRQRVHADIVTLEDMGVLSGNYKPDTEGWEVSIGFKDHRDGQNQIIDRVDHLAVSLRNKEMGRCRAEGGDPCYINKKKNYDQNLKEVVSYIRN